MSNSDLAHGGGPTTCLIEISCVLIYGLGMPTDSYGSEGPTFNPETNPFTADFERFRSGHFEDSQARLRYKCKKMPPQLREWPEALGTSRPSGSLFVSCLNAMLLGGM